MREDGRLSGYQQARQRPQRGPCTVSSRQVRFPSAHETSKLSGFTPRCVRRVDGNQHMVA